MKRAEALQPLSRDHHQALFVAQRLRRADAETAAEARRAFLGFWRDHGSRHFRVEEDVLLPRFARAGGDLEHPGVVRMLLDHARIRGRALDLADGDAPAAELAELGEMMEAHVRLEERELFPLMEEQMSEPALDELLAAMEEAEAGG